MWHRRNRCRRQSGRARFWNSRDNVADINVEMLWSALDVVLGKEELRDITGVGFSQERLGKVKYLTTTD